MQSNIRVSKFDPLRVGVELSSDVLEKMNQSKLSNSNIDKQVCPCCRKLTSTNNYNVEKELSSLKNNSSGSSSGFIRKIHHSIRKKNFQNELTTFTKVINLSFSDGQSLGLSIRTRKFNRRQESALLSKNKNFNLKHGVFISKIRAGSLSSKENNIKVGDQVVCINGADVTGYSVKKVAGLMFMMKEDLQITLRSFVFSQLPLQNHIMEEHSQCTCSNHKQKFTSTKKLATLHENGPLVNSLSEVKSSVSINKLSKGNISLQETVTLAKPAIGRRNGSFNVGSSVTASVYDNGTPTDNNPFFAKSVEVQQYMQDPVHQKFDESLLLLQNAILGLPGFSPVVELDCCKQTENVNLANKFSYIENSSSINEIPETNLSDVDSLLSEFLGNNVNESFSLVEETKHHNNKSTSNSDSLFKKDIALNEKSKSNTKMVLFDEPDYDDVASSENEDAFEVVSYEDEIDIDELVSSPSNANKTKKRKKVVRSKSFAVSGAFSSESNPQELIPQVLIAKRTAPGLFPLISCSNGDSEDRDHVGCKNTMFSSVNKSLKENESSTDLKNSSTNFHLKVSKLTYYHIFYE